MHQPNIFQVCENLAEYLDAAARGEEALICRRNQPVARLVAVATPSREPRPIGLAADAGVPLPDSFSEPLPADLLSVLSGHDSADAGTPGVEARP